MKDNKEFLENTNLIMKNIPQTIAREDACNQGILWIDNSNIGSLFNFKVRKLNTDRINNIEDIKRVLDFLCITYSEMPGTINEEFEKVRDLFD